jgi:uncharacterized protein YceK
MEKENTMLRFWIFFCLFLIVTAVSGCSQSADSQKEEIYCVRKAKAKHSLISKERMNLTEAKRIAMSSECSEIGTLKDSYRCNELEGTWSTPVDIDVEGCSAVCVVDIAKKEAKLRVQC